MGTIGKIRDVPNNHLMYFQGANRLFLQNGRRGEGRSSGVWWVKKLFAFTWLKKSYCFAKKILTLSFLRKMISAPLFSPEKNFRPLFLIKSYQKLTATQINHFFLLLHVSYFGEHKQVSPYSHQCYYPLYEPKM